MSSDFERVGISLEFKEGIDWILMEEINLVKSIQVDVSFNLIIEAYFDYTLVIQAVHFITVDTWLAIVTKWPIDLLRISQLDHHLRLTHS